MPIASLDMRGLIYPWVCFFSHITPPFILRSCTEEHREEPWALSANPPGVGSLATIGSSPPALCILQSKAQGQTSEPMPAQLPTISHLLFLEIHVHLGGEPALFFPGLGSLEHEAGLNTCWRCHGKLRNPQQILPTFSCSPPRRRVCSQHSEHVMWGWAERKLEYLEVGASFWFTAVKRLVGFSGNFQQGLHWPFKEKVMSSIGTASQI